MEVTQLIIFRAKYLFWVGSNSVKNCTFALTMEKLRLVKILLGRALFPNPSGD